MNLNLEKNLSIFTSRPSTKLKNFQFCQLQELLKMLYIVRTSLQSVVFGFFPGARNSRLPRAVAGPQTKRTLVLRVQRTNGSVRVLLREGQGTKSWAVKVSSFDEAGQWSQRSPSIFVALSKYSPLHRIMRGSTEPIIRKKVRLDSAKKYE
ncbi:Hypothetical_protein [Hexamita inflata]|uniref:Hypothetical_protein n=1 Tax=Hexamita inflata TaxID=28002 RepID=A0ABP1GHT8_9EUKA